ncbi:MAG TPA: class I SAM-dependent methyltransferase [Bosea sp. (in: a-proteobacteria)]|uniref:class I SAM-dependent methyltransferase n=1 Tax=Bosea sp. (in: a-proteobacteria) TaxID=1871050 RepID=UPI002E14D5BE|nr:class I SAM-dependent methyltransferase [Bosea sp. (in: a-proteobacteria)]
MKLFYFMLGPISAHYRRKRMRKFCSVFHLDHHPAILDLGGQPTIWDTVVEPLDIVILNLPGRAETLHPTHHNIKYVEGDACDVVGIEKKEFDIVFSNSVIEHVGNSDFRARFASEVRRLGKSYWVQTPARYFPIEPHNGMPFWWFWPQALRAATIKRWKRTLPAWTEMVEGTDIVSREEMHRLFPEAEIYVERVWGIPKSYTAFSVT